MCLLVNVCISRNVIANHRVHICSTLADIAKQFYKVLIVVLIYTPMSKECKLQLLIVSLALIVVYLLHFSHSGGCVQISYHFSFAFSYWLVNWVSFHRFISHLNILGTQRFFLVIKVIWVNWRRSGKHRKESW